ncbi:MAG TPA: prepilin-type N-terminal cleavage/methylation domain-containing protein [Methylomirabilota bacterium]|nr:prepilin-type N-terminal cleavage/methylation domain-containing protein [Methylomirabilota bacterium]
MTKRRRVRNARGFTLIELMIVVAIIGIIAAIAFPLYAGLTGKARLTKAQADTRTIVTAVNMYWAHMETLPATLDDLTGPVTNAYGQTAGPFLATIPTPPNSAWSPYTYAPGAPPVFTVTTTGEGYTVTMP